MRKIAFTLLLSLIVASCTKSEPVRIGFLAGISGRVADLGVAGRNGAMLAVEQINSRGGVNGRQLELMIRDDEQNPATAKKAVSELVDRKIELIIGPMTSSIAMAILPQINSSETILLSPTVTTTALTGKDDNFLRVIDDTRQYATKSARYQYQRLRHHTVCAIYDQSNGAYSESWLKDFNQEFERLGGKVLQPRPFRSGGDVAYSELSREVLAGHPELVLVISNAMDAALIYQQVKKISPHVALVASEWAATERFIELAGSAAEGAVVSQFINRNDSSPRYKAFVAAYKARFGLEPGFAGLAGYDAAQVAIEALIQRKSGESLKQAIIRIASFQGAQQQILINRFGDASRASYITEVRNGSFHTLE